MHGILGHNEVLSLFGFDLPEGPGAIFPHIRESGV